MKKLLTAVGIVALSANMAFAFAEAEFNQVQGQFDGGISAPPGFIGGGAQGQLGGGYVLSEPGDTAAVQFDQNQTVTGVESWDGVSGTTWEGNQFQYTEGASNQGPGFAIAGGAQGQFGGAAGLNDMNGTASVAGSAYAGGGINGALALGDAGIVQAQGQSFEGEYVQVNQGANSYIAQTGTQEAGTFQVVGAGGLGAGLATSGVAQFGGTAGLNDGNAGAMATSGHAEGDATAGAVALGGAGALALAGGTQTHSIQSEAVSADGTNYQQSSGTVTTTVVAGAAD